MRKVLIVFGTRPEAIKMAPLVKEFAKHGDSIETKVCVTAQHREMLDQVLTLFEIIPDYDLNIMKPGQDLFDVTSNVMLGMKKVLDDFNPDIVFVHGDTTTSFAAALSAFYRNIKIAHVEAGLRTYNLQSPWPEEANRQLTGRLADYNFAPTKQASRNLKDEGRSENSVIVTGNTVIDSLFWVLEKRINSNREISCEYMLSDQKVVLITGHRRENFGQGFYNICYAIKELAIKYNNYDFVYPVHLNPNVQKVVFEVLDGIDNVILIEPLDYLPFIFLMSKADIILTDSGGIQEEAPSLGKPVLVMRDTTERPEAVEAGTVKLVGTNKDKIIAEVSHLIDDSKYYDSMSEANNPYGDGKACSRIVNHIISEI